MMDKHQPQDIKIGHFIWSAQFGGIGKVVSDLCKYQESAGDVSPVLFIGRSGGEMIEDFMRSDVTIKELGLKNGRDLSLKTYRSIKKLLEPMDIIHMHTFNPLVAYAAIRIRKPIVYTIHGNFGFNRTLSPLEKLNKRMLKYFLNRYVSFITFNSNFANDQAKRFYGIGNIPQQVIENGVLFHETQHTEIDQETLNFISNKKVIGTSSRFVEVKRIDELIIAFSKLAKIHSEAVLVLIGDGKLKENYNAQAEALGIIDKVHFTGFRKNVTAYQSILDICVFPSINEAFGLVAIETLALGKPTIVFEDGGGIADIINKLRPEDVVKDTDELVSRMKYYLDNGTSSEAVDAFRSFARTYDISSMSNKLQRLYSSLVA